MLDFDFDIIKEALVRENIFSSDDVDKLISYLEKIINVESIFDHIRFLLSCREDIVVGYIISKKQPVFRIIKDTPEDFYKGLCSFAWNRADYYDLSEYGIDWRACEISIIEAKEISSINDIAVYKDEDYEYNWIIKIYLKNGQEIEIIFNLENDDYTLN